MGLAEKELKSSFTDSRFLGTILVSFIVTLFITQVLIDAVGSFSQGNLISSLPVSSRLVKIAVVEEGYHQSVTELENISSAYIVKTDLRSAQDMLARDEVHAIYIVNGTSGRFIGSKKPISVLAELSVKEAVDKVVRPDGASNYDFDEGTGLQDLVRGLLTPILLFSPIFLLGLPIIQSIAYDRENRVLEVLFATPIDRKRILLSKVLANMLFILIVGALWVAIVYFAGFRFYDPVGVFVVLMSVSFLMVSMNALLSSLSRTIQEATLASSISSTIIFTTLFLITMLKIVPQIQFIADISPATYIAVQVTSPAAFPFYSVAALLIIAFSALILAVSAFSTEAFAFSIKPGVKQLYEGMVDILGGGYKAAIGM
ncbi:MAG: ABC transporter permease, partial [Candidatus Micrarchaeota archaeon]